MQEEMLKMLSGVSCAWFSCHGFCVFRLGFTKIFRFRHVEAFEFRPVLALGSTFLRAARQFSKHLNGRLKGCRARL